MRNRKIYFVIFFFVVLMLFSSVGCNQIFKQTESDEIKSKIQSNDIYKIEFDYNTPKVVGDIKYDFNNDGKNDVLNCVISGTPGITAEKVSFTINGKTVEKETESHGSWEVFSEFGILDVDTKDNFVEFYITEGYVGGGTAFLYRLTEQGIVEAAVITGGIEGVSGDGKIYYWGGNLFEVFNEKFSTDMVISYYDINKKEIVKTNQIIGKTITAKERIILYKEQEFVIGDQSQAAIDTFENIVKKSEDKIVKIIEIGETFQVVNLDQETQVKTADGKIGWIGGFHVTAD